MPDDEPTTPPEGPRAASSAPPDAMREPGSPAIAVHDASVVLGSTLILDAIDLTVHQGESVALLGANGSGKSTLVRTILGLHPLRTGSVQLFGHDVTRRRRVPWERVGYVPQRVAAASGVPATALEVVRSGLLSPTRPFADRGRAARRRALDALDAVGLAERASEHVQVFSGGQAQRVLIARALVRDPDVLLLDEPLAGIDRASRQALASILAELRHRGVALVTVLHEMGELADVVERAVVLADGRIVSDGPAADLHHDQHRLEHDAVGHDRTADCEHEHPHGESRPVVHHAPSLRGWGRRPVGTS